MKKVTLYQKDTAGRVKVWDMEVVNKGDHSEMVSHSGLEDGKMTPEVTIVDKGKNEGKANETTHYTQAVAEAQSKIEKKIAKGYVADKAEIKDSSELGSGVKKPLLAHKYHPTGAQSSSKTLKQMGIEGKKIMVQRKKDGNRFRIIIDNGTISTFSREGKPMQVMPHITDTVRENYKKALANGFSYTRLELDGELYTKEISFNTFNGLVKPGARTEAEQALLKQVNYHLYDVDLPMGYELRYKVIQQFASPTVHIEEAFEIVATDENIKAMFEKFLEEGEEGLMIRTLGVPYENKRSWALVKCKIFEDSEFEVVGFEESTRRGMVGAVICKLDTRLAYDRNGKQITTFKAGLKMSHEEAIKIWNNQAKYIGLRGTVEYFGRSEYSVPRFGKFKAFRD